MMRIRTWFRAHRKRHWSFHDRGQTANRPLEVDKPADTPVERLEDMPVDKTADIPVEKPAETPGSQTVNNPESNGASVSTTSRRIQVLVVSVLDDNDTTTGAIAKGLLKVSDVMKTLRGLAARGQPSVTRHPSVTDKISEIIINVINTMATVQDQQKPRRIHAYHVYATRTAIAGYIGIRAFLNTNPNDSGAATVLGDAFGACVNLGMATLVTPAPYSACLASALAGKIKQAAIWRAVWSSEQAYAHAKEITKMHTPEFVTCGRMAPVGSSKSPKLPDLYPLVGILTSKELAGFARGLAFRQRFTYGTDRTTKEAAELLESLFADMDPVCPCRADNYPVCFCNLKPMSHEEYQDLGGRLLLCV